MPTRHYPGLVTSGTDRIRHPRVPWGLVIAAAVLGGATIALLWLVAVPLGPVVCPAIDPAPANCLPENRAGTALVVSGVVGVVALATVLFGVLVRRPRGPVVAGAVLLAPAPIVAYLVVAWSPGFVLGGP